MHPCAPIDTAPKLLTHTRGCGAGQHAGRRARGSPCPPGPGTEPRDGRKPPAAPRHPAKQTQSCPSPPAGCANSPVFGGTSSQRDARLCMGTVQLRRAPHPAQQQQLGQGAQQPSSVPSHPCRAASLAPSPGPGGARRVWGGGFSPAWVLSPGSRVHAGLGSALTQREQQAEASEVQGGLREPGFRAHFEGV